MKISRGARVLVVCPHTDDEFGCAGSIARFLDEGAEVHYSALSRCEQSVPDGLPLDTLERECRAATKALGIPEGNVSVLDYEVRHFPSVRQEILEYFVRLNRELRPTVVLLPSASDTHQDHATVAQEGFRAFKISTILGYELPQNLVSFNNSAFVQLTSEHLDRKLRALAMYESQTFRPYASEQFIRSLATVRGAQVRAEYAEAFELVRLIL